MTKIDTSRLQIEDAEKLDILFAVCARAAMKEAQKKQRKRRAAKNQTKLVTSERQYIPASEDGLSRLFSAYESNLFFYPDAQHKKDVRYRLEIELGRINFSSNVACFELMLPIMAYTLLVNNEYKYETVRARIRNHKHEGNQDDRNPWKFVNPFSIKQGMNLPASSAFYEKAEKLKNAIAESGQRKLNNKLCIHQTYAFLSRPKLVMLLQDSARIALFLKDILIKSYRKDRPLDTLIRFYLANQLDGLLFRSSSIQAGDSRKKRGNLTENNILSHYVSCCSDDESQPIIQQLWGLPSEDKDEEESRLDIHIPADLEKMEFDDLYEMLISNFTISEDSLDDLLDFYFNKESLIKCSELSDSILLFADDVIADINSVAQTTERELPYYLQKLVFSTIRRKSDIVVIKGYHTVGTNQRWTGRRHKRERTCPIPLTKCVFDEWFNIQRQNKSKLTHGQK